MGDLSEAPPPLRSSLPSATHLYGEWIRRGCSNGGERVTAKYNNALR